jgi:hypothetical protein
MTRFIARPLAAILALTLVATACTADTSTAASSPASVTQLNTSDAGSPATAPAQVEKDLASLRRAVAPFHRFVAASELGWSAKITSCMADPVNGGMGFHYGNVGLIDGAVQPDKPELLLYEPQANGTLRFVAVEYVIPYTFHARDADAPVLFGRTFARNDRFQLWGLHVWVGTSNPSGLFTSWNPAVTCTYTTDLDQVPMTHG